jgi:hypothetical protein
MSQDEASAMTFNYIEIADKYIQGKGGEVLPGPGNGQEQTWYDVSIENVPSFWETSKEGYDKWHNDAVGELTHRRQLAFARQAALKFNIEVSN